MFILLSGDLIYRLDLLDCILDCWRCLIVLICVVLCFCLINILVCLVFVGCLFYLAMYFGFY